MILVIAGVALWQRAAWWPAPYQMLARRALAAHDNSAALRWLDWATLAAPETGETAFLRARALRKSGQLSQSADALQRALTLGVPVARLQREQWLGLAQSGQMKEAEPHYSELLTSPGDDGEEICEAFVLGYMRTQRFGLALQLLEAWIADWPRQGYPYLMRGRIYAIQQQSANAEADFRRALELDSGNVDARFELATVLKDGNRPVEAIPEFERCLSDPRLGVPSRVGLAICLKATGDLLRIESLLDETLKSEPDNPDALRELARLRLESGDYREVVPLMESALRVVPYDDESHYILAQALRALGRSEEALPHFKFTSEARAAFRELNVLQDRLRLNPADVATLVRTGEIMLKYAAPEEGVIRLLAAVDLEPRNQPARRLLVEYYDDRAKLDIRFRRLAAEHRKWLDTEHENTKSATDAPKSR